MLLWLADVLRDAGCMVIEYDGWRTRGKDRIVPEGIVWHHTATPRTAKDATVRKLLAGGRPDLAGPLCHLGLERDGVFVVIAAGRANHAGYGTPWGNDSIGIEAYNDGTGEPWPKPQVDAYRKGTAALLRHLHLSESAVKGHKEVDPHRKIDPLGLDMPHERAAIRALLHPEEDTLSAEDVKKINAHTDAKAKEILAAVAEVREDIASKKIRGSFESVLAKLDQLLARP